jgi:TatA/E family protein of Tat protein translocase
VLVLFGAGRIPEIMRSLGRGIREFKTSVENTHDKDKDLPGGKQ